MATATAIKRPHRAKEESHNEAPPKKSDYAQEVAAKIITQLEAGTAPWQRPWKAGMRPPPGQGMPYNAVSGNGYRGMNAVNPLLEQQEKGYQDDRWLTYQQALDVGGQVRKGAKGTTVLYYKFNDREKGAAPEGESTAADGRRSSVSVFYARVFNGDQIEGMPPVKVREPPKEKERHELCEKLIADAGVPIHHDGGDQAYYHPIKDSIHLPLRGAFKTSDGFYATALHELGHSTGHPSRLKRDLTGRFGTPEYAREELTAEISSMMMGERLGIGHDPSQHVAYVKSWIGLLKDDPKVILKACSEAEKVCTFLNIPQYEREKLPLVERERLSTEEKKARWQAQEKAKEPEQTQAPAQVSSPQPEAPSAPQPVAKPAARKRTRTRQQSQGMSL